MEEAREGEEAAVALVTLPEVDEVSCAGGRTGTSGADMRATVGSRKIMQAKREIGTGPVFQFYTLLKVLACSLMPALRTVI